MKYVVVKKNKFEKILIDEMPKGYKFKPKYKDIKSITLVSNKMIDTVLTAKINDMFVRLLMIVNDAFNSDDNPSGVAIALDEIAMVQSVLLNKYNKILDKRKQLLYLKKLEMLEKEMKYKAYMLENYFKEESQGKSR